MELAPIVLFVYNRPQHTAKVLHALSEAELAQNSHLYIFCDGPKSDAFEKNIKSINEVRAIVKSKKWCGEVTVYESDVNLGLAKSITLGVTKIVNKHGKIIVLEDDIIVSKIFLKYMNDALLFYQSSNQVMQISSYFPPIETEKKLPTTFFYNHNSCWGWATWDRAWSFYIDDTNLLFDSLLKIKNFNPYDFSKGFGVEFFFQLIQNKIKKMNTWAVKWHASVYINKGLILHPRLALVKNIGIDGTGQNSGFLNYRVNSNGPLPSSFHYIFGDNLIENKKAINLVKKYFYTNIFNYIRLPKRLYSIISNSISHIQKERYTI